MNNLILAKERQIIDLQEMCTEQGQVAHSKSLAIHIVNRRLQELDAKQVNDVATETTDLLDISGTNSTPESLRRSRSRSPHRSSPGRAFPQFRIGLQKIFSWIYFSCCMHVVFPPPGYLPGFFVGFRRLSLPSGLLDFCRCTFFTQFLFGSLDDFSFLIITDTIFL